VWLSLACCTREEHALVSARFSSQKSGALHALPWRGLSLCREMCAVLPSRALPLAAGLLLLSAGDGAEISAWKFAAPGTVMAGWISACPDSLVRLEQGKVPMCFANFAVCSTPAGALNELPSLSLCAGMQWSYTVPRLASSSQITCSLVLLRPSSCSKRQARRIDSFPTSCQFSYQGSPIYSLYTCPLSLP